MTSKIPLASTWALLGLAAVLMLLFGSYGGAVLASVANIPRWVGSLIGLATAFLAGGILMRQAAARLDRSP